MQIVRTYKYRLKPTAEQAERMNRWCAAVRAVYNAALEQRLMYGRIHYTRPLDGERITDHAKQRGYVERRRREIDDKREGLLAKATIQTKIDEGRIDLTTLGGIIGAIGPDPFERRSSFSAVGQSYEIQFRNWKNDPDLEWLTDAPWDSLGFGLRDLDNAFKHFFEGRARFPSWRNAIENNSFTLKGFVSRKVNVVFGRSRVKLPKLGYVRYWKHKKLKGRVRTVTVIREGAHWYICASAEIEIRDPKPTLRPPVGIDIGVAYPVVLSTGEALEPDAGLVKLDKRRRRLQRELSRRDRQSRRRLRTRERVAKVARRIAARRKARLHQVTTDLVRRFGFIAVEDLKVRNMTRSAKGDADEPGRNVKAKSGLNREMLNVAPFEFRLQLDYKAKAAGVPVEGVDPRFTSQACSVCGVVDPASRRSQSSFVCVGCGHTENADLNAARNILRAAAARRPKAPSDPYHGRPWTGTATPNPAVSPLWVGISPHLSVVAASESGGPPNG